MARSVLKAIPEVAQLVLAGDTPLADAYREAGDQCLGGRHWGLRGVTDLERLALNVTSGTMMLMGLASDRLCSSLINVPAEVDGESVSRYAIAV